MQATACSVKLCCRSLSQVGDHLLQALGRQAFLDLLAFCLPARHIQALDRALYDILHQLAGPCFLACRGVLDCALASGVADIHPIGIVLISYHEVHNHVDNDLTVRAILFYFNIGVDAREHSDIVTRDAFDLGDQLLLAFFRHLAVLDCQVESLLIRLHGGLFEHSSVVLHRIFQGH